MRTLTFCASGAATRNVTRLSGWMQGYGAPGMLREFGLQSAGGCARTPAPMPAHRYAEANAATNVTFFMTCESDLVVQYDRIILGRSHRALDRRPHPLVTRRGYPFLAQLFALELEFEAVVVIGGRGALEDRAPLE